MTAVDPNGRGWRHAGHELSYVAEVLDGGFGAGPEGSMVSRFERRFHEAVGLPFMIAFNSGTGTLHAVLYAFGIGPGDEVIVPVLTPAMCGFVVHHTGATPVFADVLPDTFLLDPDDVERKITPRTKAIMAVHIYGQVCDMDRLMVIARRHGLRVLEDCAQCFLGTDVHGRIGGTIGDAASWSLEASKHLSSGEGGVAGCSDTALGTEIRKFGGLGFKTLTAETGDARISRDQRQDPEWTRHDRIGYNCRMSEITAAVALAQVERLRHFVDLRIAMGEAYRRAMSRSTLLTPQAIPAGAVHSYFTFAASFDGGEHGIPWKTFRQVYVENGGDGIYAAWMPMNREPAFVQSRIGRGETPTAWSLQKKIMQFTTNQRDAAERERQLDALARTLRHFGDQEA